jgi:hypothetical protein
VNTPGKTDLEVVREIVSAVPNLLTDFLEIEKFVEAQPEGTHAEIIRGVYLFFAEALFSL